MAPAFVKQPFQCQDLTYGTAVGSVRPFEGPVPEGDSQGPNRIVMTALSQVKVHGGEPRCAR